MSDVCPMCGAGHIQYSTGTLDYTEGGLIRVKLHGATLGKCDACGERFEGVQDIERLQQAIVRWLATKGEQLAPGEIKYIRKAAFGLSAKDLALKLDVQAETLSRWENGKEVMSATTERFFRMLALAERPIEEYPLEEMATGAPLASELSATMDAGSWRLAAG